MVTAGSAGSSRADTRPSWPSTSTSPADAGAAPTRLHHIATNTQQAIRMTPTTPMLGSKLRREVRCNLLLMRPRSLLLLLVAALALGLLAGCGGGDDDGGKEASASTDVNELLKDTFSGDQSIKS